MHGAMLCDARIFGMLNDWQVQLCAQLQRFAHDVIVEDRLTVIGNSYCSGALEYAGKVGTGFDHETLHSLGAQLRALRRPDSPFVNSGSIRERSVNWVQPRLVAQVAFTEWTPYGRLRHPRFLGLRDDKSASEVVREG